MALSDPYATPQQYRLSIHKTDQDEEEELLRDLIGVSRVMEKELHTFFNKDDQLVFRYYDAPYTAGANPWMGTSYAEAENPWRHLRGEPYLYPDPIADATGIEIWVDSNRDETYSTQLTPTDYLLLPRNALVGPEPLPYKYIARRDNNNWVPGANFKIKAIWGWPAVPVAIERACIHITAILRIESPRATATIDQMGSAIGASKECQDILGKLMKPYKRELLATASR